MVQDPDEQTKLLLRVAMFIFAAYFFVQCFALVRHCMTHH